MNDAESVDIVQKQIERLHAEVLERVKAFSALWRTVILGVAGILALKGAPDQSNFGIAMFVAPPLLMLVLAYWLNEQGSLVLVARAMAREEEKLNNIAGTELLTYEQDRLAARRSAFAYRTDVIVTIGVVVSTVYFALAIWLLYSGSAAGYQGRPELLAAYWFLTGSAYLVALVNASRIYVLTQQSRSFSDVTPREQPPSAAERIVGADGRRSAPQDSQVPVGRPAVDLRR